MLRIAAFQFLSYFKIGALPEAAQILSQLHRLETWRQKFHQYRLFSVIHARCFLHSKALLQAYAQYRNFSTLAVIELDSATRRNLDMGRSQPIDFLLKFIRNTIPQNFFQIDFLLPDKREASLVHVPSDKKYSDSESPVQDAILPLEPHASAASAPVRSSRTC